MEDEDEARQDSGTSGLETAAKLLSLLYGLISVLWLIWIVIPEHRKRLLAMRMVKTLERSAWKSAFRAGQQAMGRELKGRGTSYELPYRLSRVGEQAGKAYDKLRYTA